MSILFIENLNLGFFAQKDFHQALFDVSLELKENSIHALVGESGCGKSITAMSILNLLPKNAKIISGKIDFLGTNILNSSKTDLQNIRGAQIALIPQDPMTSLNPLFTIKNQLFEVISLHNKNLDKKQIEEKAIEALRLVQISEPSMCLKSYPHELSGGMKQRIVIAMALACNAKIIIADEPTTALDVTIQAQIMDLLLKIKEHAKTSILLITHDLALVKNYTDEVSVMYSGRIIEHAPSNEFFNNTAHPYSNALIRALPTSKTKELKVLSGQPPAINEKISGCKFHPRCEFCLTNSCPKIVPKLKEITPNHFVACHLK